MEMVFYNINQVAELLGVSRWTVSEACKPDRRTGKAKLANHRIGKRVIISADDLKLYLDNTKIEASSLP